MTSIFSDEAFIAISPIHIFQSTYSTEILQDSISPQENEGQRCIV
jgi:hypothetical protein